jgi:hypothetical protein
MSINAVNSNGKVTADHAEAEACPPLVGTSKSGKIRQRASHFFPSPLWRCPASTTAAGARPLASSSGVGMNLTFPFCRSGKVAGLKPDPKRSFFLPPLSKRTFIRFYSDKTAARLLCLSEAELRQARLGLLQAGLIACEAPLYQVLSLEPILSTEQPIPRTGQAPPLSAILRQMLESEGPQQP